ncbi:hypothetical protein Fcan01_28573 [Folsomia candida]|uniref:Uncharacterized protein n=1 Tax=Folsomia candida TaxID=158441 RepID=A0A226CUM0_FOLCA|nr:hypothetical protein Fcan01_28573 [Folsomia candida]
MPPVTARDSVKGAFYALGHDYKSETEHFCDNFKGIRENSEIPKLHEKGKPKSCMSCQMPPVTVRDSGKGALYAPRCGLESHGYKSETEHFCDNFKGIRENCEIKKHENGKPKSCHSYKSETEHFCDNFKGIRENSEIPKLHEKGKPKSCMSCQMPPVTARDSERARFTPLGMLQSETEHFCDNFKGIRENSEIRNTEKGKPKSCMSCQMPPVTARDSERARFTPLGHGYKAMATKVKRSTFAITLKESEKTRNTKLHEKGKPKSCMSCQMPPVTARDSGKGAFYAPRP